MLSNPVAKQARLAGVGAALAAAVPAAAQVPAAPAGAIQEIIVKGQSLRLLDNAFSTTTLSSALIKERRVNRSMNCCRDIPGVSLQDFGLGGVASATAIRGFGPAAMAATWGGGRRHPAQRVQLACRRLCRHQRARPARDRGDDRVPGPVSALYGNFNPGGLIAFETRKGGDYAEFDVAAGSFRTFDAEAALGLTSRGGQQFNAAAQVFHSDGYRPQSELDRITVAARYAIDLSDAVDVAISGRYNRTRADNAGI
jgi:outer membrane receptor protein involved in Fe transport